jgi:hypothetical protein
MSRAITENIGNAPSGVTNLCSVTALMTWKLLWSCPKDIKLDCSDGRWLVTQRYLPFSTAWRSSTAGALMH